MWRSETNGPEVNHSESDFSRANVDIFSVCSPKPVLDDLVSYIQAPGYITRSFGNPLVHNLHIN